MAKMFNNISELRAWETNVAINQGANIDEEAIIYEILAGVGETIKREELLDRMASQFKCTKEVAELVFLDRIDKLLESGKVKRVQHGYYRAV